MKGLIKYGMILGTICLISAGLLACVNLLTKERILAQINNEETASLKEIFPDAVSFSPVKQKDTILYYLAEDSHKNILGAAFKAHGKGYSSVIETMAGVTPDGTITAIKVLNQNETPGLGSRICEVEADTTIFEAMKGKAKQTTPKKPWFQEQFCNKNIDNFDSIEAITGATISSRAVITSVQKRAKEVLEMIKHNQ
ncbi:MAG: RnfABCDGE type electron transport complex subunit G [Candidatus Omnitrophica bacterium]|nr:RnfABCDGE type electron transport complex subunit G [Candidatus Omnitrophota bacterium]